MENQNGNEYQVEKMLISEPVFEKRIIIQTVGDYDEKPPKDHLILSVFVTCFLSLFGLVAVIYSVKTCEAIKYGNLREAKRCSKNAKFYNLLAILLAVLIALVYFFVLDTLNKTKKKSLPPYSIEATMESQKQYDAEYGKLQQAQVPPYAQPAYVPVVQGQQPKSYLVFSILNTFCCCLIFGIVSIVYSVKTREANRYGNYQEATIYSQKAKKFNIIALSVGLCIIVCYTILTVIKLYLAFYVSAASENSANYINNSSN